MVSNLKLHFFKNAFQNAIQIGRKFLQVNITQIIGRCLLISSALCLLSSCEVKGYKPYTVEKIVVDGKEYAIIKPWNGSCIIVPNQDCKCKDKHD